MSQADLPVVAETEEERAQRAAAAAAALDQVAEPEHEELLGFYDRLRERVLGGVERHAGKWSEATVEVLLLAPDLFLLLVRLSLDRRVPKRTRALIGGTLAYFVLPLDLLPEAILGPVGYLDDLVLTAAVLSQAFGGELEKYTRVHWSGTHELDKVLERINSSADALLGRGLYDRLRALLARHGIKLGR
ncbi:MAG: DUF1232 domain-containing protein [Acidobacteriota bacterium]